jgi:protein-tyrosine-phosphatase
LAELLGSAFLAALVIGPGSAAQQLSPHELGLELFANAAATAAGLYAIILMFGPVSGGHFNPVVSLVDASFGGIAWRDALAYLTGQVEQLRHPCDLDRPDALQHVRRDRARLRPCLRRRPDDRRWAGVARDPSAVPGSPAPLRTGRPVSTVLFVCLHNAGRSQISQALFEQAAGGHHHALSAGTTPGEHVHPEIVVVMRELGIDLAERIPQLLTRALAEQADLVITMGCGDQCHTFRESATSTGISPTPAGRPVEGVRAIRDEIAQRVRELVAELDAAAGHATYHSWSTTAEERLREDVGQLTEEGAADTLRLPDQQTDALRRDLGPLDQD